jgi:DNA-binding protein H-NS
MMTLKAVQAQIRKLEAQAEKLRQVEKPGIAQLKALVAKYKLKPADISLALKSDGRAASKHGVRKGATLKPKYRNPANRKETWAGRGHRPKWFAALIAKGKKPEDMAI